MGTVIPPASRNRILAAEPLPRPRLPVGSWIRDGLCAGEDPAIFFPPRGKEAAAKAVCAACPVRRECLRHALKAPEEHGIWGGLDEDERAAIRRRRSQAARRGRGAA